MQYFVVAAVSWMLIEVLDMYLMFVRVWSSVPHYILKASLFGWGFPALLSVAAVIAHYGIIDNGGGFSDDERMYPLYRETGM